MRTFLFCGGLGTRIQEYSDTIPKPMIPIGQRPILWHVMNYYAQYGHADFVLCLGHKSNVIKDFFLKWRPENFADCIVSSRNGQIAFVEPIADDWRIALIDTGIWRNIGQRLMTVRHHVDEDLFLANYSDSLTDACLDTMIEQFKASGKVASFLAVRPPLTFHFADIEKSGRVRSFKSKDNSDLWINGGYFIFRREIFDYICEGEELVEKPFGRLIADDQLMAFRHEGFWRTMDTLRDRQVLEEMTERGEMPWRLDKIAAKPLSLIT